MYMNIEKRISIYALTRKALFDKNTKEVKNSN